ncbi:hypothetical protein N431DRAFT_494006 [Stipitochalara longipes BDJ]|nr:hypothetical protein N431DRAFT_494006 [Stipitochalara longipes BDJ]
MITRLSATPLLSTLVEHKAIANFPRATNVTADALQVICAWPLSGQYGPGSRLLYYAFVITSLLARKAKWLKTACFAATMLFPAVAAIHGIVLASVHIKGAVDLDIYGALETCAIGIIAAPVTIRLSPEYYYDLGRNTIFLWLCLVLAGLTSITVEFYRVTTSDCATDDFGNPVSTQAIKFPYGNATCGLNCSVDNGPWSSIRRGSTNNIYVIPSPAILTFGVATLCAAACCIPGILMLTGTWNRIFESNWRARFGTASGDLQPIEGTNGATLQGMKGVNVQIRKLMHVLAYPFFVLIALAILIIGEINFWSQPVRYQSEPMSSIGK